MKGCCIAGAMIEVANFCSQVLDVGERSEKRGVSHSEGKVGVDVGGT